MNATLIVGLGNPGAQYERTRHNIGFRVLDTFVERSDNAWTPWNSDKGALVASATIRDAKVFAVKPKTFMNESGIPISRFVSFYHIPLNRVWVVHDDLDLPFGELKEAFDRGDAGHQGIASIINTLGTKAFHRLRIGIGSNKPLGIASEDYVLQKFTGDEERMLIAPDGILDKVCEFLRTKLFSK